MPRQSALATLIPRLRRLVEQRGFARTHICRFMGCHPNTLQRLNDPTWTPQLDTMLGIEKFVAAAEADPDLRLSGDGWSLAHDADGWAIVRDRCAAPGPFDDPIDALAAAKKLETADGGTADSNTS